MIVGAVNEPIFFGQNNCTSILEPVYSDNTENLVKLANARQPEFWIYSQPPAQVIDWIAFSPSESPYQ